jgi:hypothetical protein
MAPSAGPRSLQSRGVQLRAPRRGGARLGRRRLGCAVARRCRPGLARCRCAECNSALHGGAVHGLAGVDLAGLAGVDLRACRSGAATAIESGSSQPISRVLSWTAIHLGCTSPYTSCGLPGSDAGHIVGSLFGLAPGGVCRATPCYHACGALLPHPFTLTARRTGVGGLLSAALSVGSRLPGVTWHPALWSPDFPPERVLRRARAAVWLTRTHRIRPCSVKTYPRSAPPCCNPIRRRYSSDLSRPVRRAPMRAA